MAQLPWIDLAPAAGLSGLAWPPVPPLDPHLLLAAASGWIDHFPQPGLPARVRISLQLQPGRPLPVVQGFTATPAPATARHVTGHADVVALLGLLLHPDVLRLQLAEAALPQRPADVRRLPWQPPAPAIGAPGSAAAVGDLLLAVIDDGCPFAHADLRRPGAVGTPARTRVVSLWDQDGTLGQTPPAGYGAELEGDQLDRLMAAATDAGGAVDEQRCYLMAGADPAWRAWSHGAHALGLLAAPRRLDGRPLPGLVPPVRVLADEAATADVAFVQLRRKLLAAPFPPATEHHVIDALRHLLALAVRRRARRLEVVFGYESWLGPHGHQGWFDGALQEVVGEAAAQGVALNIGLVAGNAGAQHVHGVAVPQRNQASFALHLPPDHEMTTHLQLWMPGGGHPQLQLVLTPPGQPPLPALAWGDAAAWPSLLQPQLGVVMQHSRVLDLADDVVVLRFSPTRVYGAGQAAAPHGRWTLTLISDQSLDNVHLYIGRATSSFGAPPRGRQPCLLERPGGAGGRDRRFTANGHGCSATPTVLTSAVAQRWVYGASLPSLASGPAVLSSGMAPPQAGQVAPYAGAGPARAGGRVGPEGAMVVEHGVYHPGWLGMGNRSATCFRLVGTSVAGPLGTRRRLQGAAQKLPVAYPERPEQGGPWDLDPF